MDRYFSILPLVQCFHLPISAFTKHTIMLYYFNFISNNPRYHIFYKICSILICFDYIQRYKCNYIYFLFSVISLMHFFVDIIKIIPCYMFLLVYYEPLKTFNLLILYCISLKCSLTHLCTYVILKELFI